MDKTVILMFYDITGPDIDNLINHPDPKCVVILLNHLKSLIYIIINHAIAIIKIFLHPFICIFNIFKDQIKKQTVDHRIIICRL